MEKLVAGAGRQALREKPPERDPEPRRQPSSPRPQGREERASAGGRRRLYDDRLFGDVLALKRWLARRHGE